MRIGMFETFTEWLKLREKKPSREKDSHVTVDGSRLDSFLQAADNLEKDWEELEAVTDKKSKEPKKPAGKPDKPFDKDKPEEKDEKPDKKKSPFGKDDEDDDDEPAEKKPAFGAKKSPFGKRPKPEAEEEKPAFPRKKKEPKDVANPRMDVRGPRDLR
jgi:hypothetical protein